MHFLISEGYDEFDVIRSATINPVNHYNLEAGLLQPGQSADFIVVDNLREMNVLETWIKGKKVFSNGNVMFNYSPGNVVNNFICTHVHEKEIKVNNQQGKIRVIEAFEGELMTKELVVNSGTNKWIESDTENDILENCN